MSVRTVPLTNKSRSQLVANRFLITLGQVFGSNTFTSRDVANRFGLDFLHVAKILSRMSRKPYYLLSVWKVPRDFGGVENVYRISPHGWSKKCYLLSQEPAALKGASRESIAAAASYLITGKGYESDLLNVPLFRNLVGKTSSPLDEIGLFLSNLDFQILIEEHVFTHGIFAKDEQLKTIIRCIQLQRLGLIPNDIDLKTFVTVAFSMGASASSILIGLLIRGGIKLKNDLFETTIRSGIRAGFLQFHLDARSSIISERKTQFEVQKHYADSLRNDLDNSRLDNYKLNHRVTELESHIEFTSQAMALIVENLEKIKDPPIILLPLRALVEFELGLIMLMNYSVRWKRS